MDFEKKHQEDLQRLRGFRLLDDDFMTKVFEDIQCAELLIRIILNDEGIHVLFFHSFGPRFAFFMMFSPLLGFNRSVCSHKVLSRKGGPAVVLPTIS